MRLPFLRQLKTAVIAGGIFVVLATPARAANCGQPIINAFGFVPAATAINKSLMMTFIPVVGETANGTHKMTVGFNAAQADAYTCFLNNDAPLLVTALPGSQSIQLLVPSPSKTMTLEWTDGANVLPVTYQVFTGSTPASLTNIAVGVPSASYLLSSLDFTRPYYWQVAAADSFGRTTTSSVYSFSIVPLVSKLIAAPNPFHPGRGTTTFLFTMQGAGSARIEIYSLPDGRMVYSRQLDGLQNGANVFEYDGRDSGGRLLQNGVYSVKLRMSGTGGTSTQSFKIVSVR